MTDTCATCQYYVAPQCRKDAITAASERVVPPTFWCGEFTAGSAGTGAAVTAMAAVPAGAGAILWAAKADGTMWVSLDSAATWTQVVSP